MTLNVKLQLLHNFCSPQITERNTQPVSNNKEMWSLPLNCYLDAEQAERTVVSEFSLLLDGFLIW